MITLNEYLEEANSPIKINVDSTMAKVIKGDYGENIKEYVNRMAEDLGMKTGEIGWSSERFVVKGTGKSGEIYIYQEGEYDMYGGPYSPKMSKPEVTLNNKDMWKRVEKEFKDYGWDEEGVDMSRTDIYGNIF